MHAPRGGLRRVRVVIVCRRGGVKDSGGSRPEKAHSRTRTAGASPCFDLATAELRRSASECRFHAYSLSPRVIADEIATT
jgi:hypothetical protein